MIRKLIRTDGSALDLAPGKRLSTQEIHELIGADTLDTVQLRHLGHPPHVMFVDDAGYEKELPMNVEATRMYLANCRPGTMHKIRGDVVVAPDSDFGEH